MRANRLAELPNPGLPLSPRERSILELRDRGEAYKEIAPRLKISIKTVEFHVHNILRKTHARSTAEASFKLRESVLAA
jgi:DNA-binding NarL/FixJ family response regulator